MASSTIAFAACAGVYDEEPAIEESIQASVAAWNSQDAAGFLDRFTDNGLLDTFEVTREAATASLTESTIS